MEPGRTSTNGVEMRQSAIADMRDNTSDTFE